MTIDSNVRADQDLPRVLVLSGTTAVGKTEVSIPLAEILRGEIVSADSRQVFRELNIGTAKPSAEQRRRVVHHFVDEKSIHDRWTAGDFAREARSRIDQILERKRIPMVVGGSMLYLRALLDGFFPFDAEFTADYEALREELAAKGSNELYRELSERDPDLAVRIHPHDHHRLLRGLSVARSGGRALSKLQSLPRVPFAHPYRLFVLYADRQWTYQRVNERVTEMIAAGLVEEVAQLRNAGVNPRNCRALQTHGYQEVFPYLEGQITRDEMIESIRKAVRHYVKRQLTWFRHTPNVHWIERGIGEAANQVAKRIEQAWRV